MKQVDYEFKYLIQERIIWERQHSKVQQKEIPQQTLAQYQRHNYKENHREIVI